MKNQDFRSILHALPARAIGRRRVILLLSGCLGIQQQNHESLAAAERVDIEMGAQMGVRLGQLACERQDLAAKQLGT